ncbi:MAG: carboxypeptidase-like regulatory domain-containing protein, partial [Cytophagaceae bacterium]
MLHFIFPRFFLLAATLLLGLVAQAGTIKGKVTGTNNEGLAFANVAVRGTAASTGSNDQGQYLLKLPAGQYQLVFQYVGYRPRTEAVRVPAGDSTVVLNVALAPESYNLTEVTVRGSDRDPA